MLAQVLCLRRLPSLLLSKENYKSFSCADTKVFFYIVATVIFRFTIQFLPDTLICSSIFIQFTVYKKCATMLIRSEAIVASK